MSGSGNPSFPPIEEIFRPKDKNTGQSAPENRQANFLHHAEMSLPTQGCPPQPYQPDTERAAQDNMTQKRYAIEAVQGETKMFSMKEISAEEARKGGISGVVVEKPAIYKTSSTIKPDSTSKSFYLIPKSKNPLKRSITAEEGEKKKQKKMDQDSNTTEKDEDVRTGRAKY